MPRRTGAGTARLRAVAAQLQRAGSAPALDTKMRSSLAATVRPFAPSVRAAILNIPVKGLVPYHQPPGLRERIAGCVETWSAQYGDLIQVGIEINAARMPSGQHSLPLYMDGVKPRWRHPVFGDSEIWVYQGNAPHPYFDQAVAPLGPASVLALQRVADDIARQIG